MAQTGILVLTALTLLLLFDSVFTKHVGEFVAVVLMAAAGGLLIAAAQDLLVIFIGLELLSLGLYILTAFAKTSGKSAEAAMKYYLFGGMSAAFLLFGFSYLYGLAGSTNLHAHAGNIRIERVRPSPLLYVAWILVVAGLGFKVAAVPFHLWAPDTYEGAPAPAAAFIASVSKVASFALLIRSGEELVAAAGRHSRRRRYTLEQMPARFTIGRGRNWRRSCWCWRRRRWWWAIWPRWRSRACGGCWLTRRLLMRATFCWGWRHPVTRSFCRAAAAAGVLFYVLTYGLTTVGAFGVVAVVERATGSDRLDSFLGLHKRNPMLAAVLLVLFLSLAGIPPLVGFWAKFNLFAAVLGVSRGAGFRWRWWASRSP